jgi:hypothetical protein
VTHWERHRETLLRSFTGEKTRSSTGRCTRHCRGRYWSRSWVTHWVRYSTGLVHPRAMQRPWSVILALIACHQPIRAPFRPFAGALVLGAGHADGTTFGEAPGVKLGPAWAGDGAELGEELEVLGSWLGLHWERARPELSKARISAGRRAGSGTWFNIGRATRDNAGTSTDQAGKC